ncbi:hypothetical protein H1D32_16950 [Anaerobacillus sp. CMMVII]|uniref:hypothetical protein n=1 Tax=Anaerobacillus sp. CMMVII TaxID=2755588 RepID=UPI0021B72C07|nr:hypothetical protein [Anaerobacillus sp. CMMVII]MCT8139242.1 hypothetical protein [Anaerobacillus sp. CMMVII]
MNKILAIILLFITLLSGCSLTNQQDYYVLVVEGEENLIKTFENYISVRKPVIEIDYYKSDKVAKKQFPEYEIEGTPLVFIFKIKEGKKKLLLRTNNMHESYAFLRSIKEDK